MAHVGDAGQAKPHLEHNPLSLLGVCNATPMRKLNDPATAQSGFSNFFRKASGRAGPLELGGADLRAGGAIAVACGCLDPLHEPAGGHAILHPREASAGMDCIQEPETQERA